MGLVKTEAFTANYCERHLRCFPGARFLDLGCGPADILRQLPPSVEYHGVDLNPSYIRFAKERYGNRGMFYCENVSQINQRGFANFDIVMAHGLIHHLDDVAVAQMLAVSKAALKEGGRLVTLDGVWTENQGWVSRQLMGLDRGRHIRTEAAYLDLVKPHFEKVKSTVYSRLLRIPYPYIVMEMAK